MAFETLGVVPIVVNAGAALLPALVAGAVSVVTVLFRPKEWGRVVREKPWVPVLLLAIIGASVGAYLWMGSGTAPVATTRGDAAGGRGTSLGIDWTAVAMQYINNQGRAPISNNPAPTTNTAPAAQASHPFIYRADNRRSAFLGGASPVGLRQAWKWTDAEDPFAMFCSSVASHGEWIYGATATLNPPNTSGVIFALSARTGEPRWPVIVQATLAGKDVPFKGFFSSPALTADGKRMVIGEGLHTDRDSSLWCIDTETGQVLWRVQTPLHVESSPAIDGDIAVVGAGAVERPEDHKVAPGDNPGYVFAVRISDGRELWRYPVNDPECSPAIKDGVCYIGAGVSGNAMVALRMESDEELKAKGVDRLLWKTPTPYPVLSAATLTDDLVLFGCGDGDYIRAGKNGSVFALDRKTGAVKWKTDSTTTPASVLSPLSVVGDRLIAGLGNGQVVALDLKDNGKLLWRQIATDGGSVNAGCAVTDSHVYALTSDGWLAVMQLADGKLVERQYVNDPQRPGELGMTFSAPLVAGGRVFVGSETGGLRAYEGAGR